MIDNRKVAIVGLGAVGASIAFALMQRGIYSEMILIDSNTDKAEGEAMDLSDGLPYAPTMTIRTGTYEDCADAALIIITAGTAQKPGETRLQLIDRNVKIMRNIVEQIKATPFEGILLIVANPVDVLTQVAQRISGYPDHRVIGSGTVLDTARLKDEISRHLSVATTNVHTMIIGEHGDSEVPVWSITNIAGMPLNDFCELRGHVHHQEAMQKLYEQVRDSAYHIIEKKGATYYGVAMAVARIAQCLARDEHAVLPVTVPIRGQYGIYGVHLSLPAVIGKDGVETIVQMPLSDQELTALRRSADSLREIVENLE